MTEIRDWIKDWDLDAWQQVDPTARQKWIHDQLWRDPLEDEDHALRWERTHREYVHEQAIKESYFLGRTPWDIGLEPQPFTVELAQAIDTVKPEHHRGIVFLSKDVRRRVLSALLANAGVRRAAQLIPRQMLRAQLETTNDSSPAEPVTRPEFVKIDSPFQDAYWFARRRLDSEADVDYRRRMPLHYLHLDAFTWARCESATLRQLWDPEARPRFQAKDVELVIDIAVRRSQAAFDLDVRRPAFLAAGAGDYRLIDLSGDLPEVNFDLEGFGTPWTIGHTPQWFVSDLTTLVGRFRDEVWAGTLFGSPRARDEILSLLIANVGLNEVFRLVPRRELWEAAL